MTGRKLLIDTNVFIGLEDEKVVAPEFAKLLALCSQYGIPVFVHEAAVQDIQRDRNQVRQKISISKIKKFASLSGVSQPSNAVLAAHFGPMPKPNDVVDVTLLYALSIGVVDFLITQDQGIHARARRCTPPLADRVFIVVDAVAWLRATYEPTAVRLPYIEEVPAHSIALSDDIFDSLRQGYPGFDDWWREKCVRAHRQCWTATIDGELAGLIVRKEETHAEAGTHYVGPKILKICTFKVKPDFRGEKLGELLLKQILWFAQRNLYDLVYLTTYDDQAVLIDVLNYYGFEKTIINQLGEGVYEKRLSREKLVVASDDNLFEIVRLNYPRFVAGPPADVFCIPIRGEYHDVLFPELAKKIQEDLFAAGTSYGQNQVKRTPGNTIRKVYLCRARTKHLKPGSVILFYRSQSPGYIASQSMTSVGVVEAVNDINSLDELVRLTAKRSVYTEHQLQELAPTGTNPVKVIDFLLIGHFDPAIPLTELKQSGVFGAHPPQSICQLPPARFGPVQEKMSFGFQI